MLTQKLLSGGFSALLPPIEGGDSRSSREIVKLAVAYHSGHLSLAQVNGDRLVWAFGRFKLSKIRTNPFILRWKGVDGATPTLVNSLRTTTGRDPTVLPERRSLPERIQNIHERVGAGTSNVVSPLVRKTSPQARQSLKQPSDSSASWLRHRIVSRLLQGPSRALKSLDQ